MISGKGMTRPIENMTSTIHSALTKPKPLNAYEWWADSASNEEFYLKLQLFLVQAIAKQTGKGIEDVRRILVQLWSSPQYKMEDDFAWMFTEKRTVEQQDQAELDDLVQSLKNKLIRIEGIHFPAPDAESNWTYQELFALTEKLHFVDCHFYGEQVFTESFYTEHSIDAVFEKCFFYNNWKVVTIDFPSTDLPLFEECEFKGETIVKGYVPTSDYTSIFRNCRLNEVIIKNIDIDTCLFYFSREIPAQLKRLKLINCTFNKKLTLDNIQNIEALEFTSTVFNKKFALIACSCEVVMIKNTNFNDLADFYMSKFGGFSLQKSIFKDFTGFEKCHFGIQAGVDQNTTLNYVTFYSFINFREAKFNQILDLRNTNRKEQPNFLDAEFNSSALQGTDRETFRIIKHSFDAVGNKVEASKYFAHEMQAYRRELKNDKKESHCRERLLLWFNAKISSHGQNYLYAIVWFIAIIAFIGAVLANDNQQWIATHFVGRRNWQWPLDVANSFALGFLPLHALLGKGKEHLAFVLFISTLLLSGVTWHLLVAIRRHSKR